MLKVRMFQSHTVPDLEGQMNHFFEGQDVTQTSQIVKFYTTAFAVPKAMGDIAYIGTLLYDATPSPHAQTQTQQQQALPEPHT
jgi:hypothetical protein